MRLKHLRNCLHEMITETTQAPGRDMAAAGRVLAAALTPRPLHERRAHLLRIFQTLTNYVIPHHQRQPRERRSNRT